MSFWDHDKVKILTDRIGAGASCNQVAKELGCSRSTVIGKAYRLGLKRPFKVVVNKPLPKRDIVPKIIPPIDKPMIITGTTLPEIGQCKWPIGELEDDDFHFCTEQAIEGLPYCHKHCQLAYRDPGRLTPDAYRGRSRRVRR